MAGEYLPRIASLHSFATCLALSPDKSTGVLRVGKGKAALVGLACQSLELVAFAQQSKFWARRNSLAS